MAEGFARARTDELVVQEMGDEVLVFDKRTDTAHCLTSSAALVWNACDGRTDPAAIVAKLAALGVDGPEAVFEFALSDLSAKDLLDKGVSRRVALKRMGTAALAAPLVISVVAPLPAHATSGGLLPLNTPCTANSQCTGALICATATSGTTKYCSDTSPCVPTGSDTGGGTGSKCSTGSPNAGQCCSNTCNTTLGVCG